MNTDEKDKNDQRNNYEGKQIKTNSVPKYVPENNSKKCLKLGGK